MSPPPLSLAKLLQGVPRGAAASVMLLPVPAGASPNQPLPPSNQPPQTLPAAALRRRLVRGGRQRI